MEKKKKFYLSLKMRLLFLLFVIVIPLTFMVAGYQRMLKIIPGPIMRSWQT